VSPASRIGIVVLVMAAIGGAFWWGQRQTAPPPAAPPPPVIQPVAPPPPPAPVPAPEKPAIAHPIESPPARPALPGLDSSDDYLKKALDDLLGKKSTLSFLIVDGLARRFVATVNNLATDNAPSSHWPIDRTAGRFDTEPGAGGTIISGKNADRYAAFVRLCEGVSTQRAVELYARVYPLLQRAYEELGFPGRYFNDRLIEVIDDLLATPVITGPIKVRQVTADGKPRPPSAGGLWIFEDSSLESRTAGQKILLRIGPDNAHRLIAKLADIRRRIAKGPGPDTAGRR
jgi:Protein of unknown function (DUF3014)